jgi:hydrogenase nickel incorporation protein HypA/HybF
MHELSLALDVLDIVMKEADKNNVTVIHEIHLDVGELSGVETDVLKTALEITGKSSLIGNAKISVNKIPGKGMCKLCNMEFGMGSFMDVCPICHSSPSEISGGKEFRLRSIVAE